MMSEEMIHNEDEVGDLTGLDDKGRSTEPPDCSAQGALTERLLLRCRSWGEIHISQQKTILRDKSKHRPGCGHQCRSNKLVSVRLERGGATVISPSLSRNTTENPI